MSRLRSQDGYLAYVGLMAALVIAMFLTVGAFKQFGMTGGAGGGGGAGAETDPVAQVEAQRAFAALQYCARMQGGSYNTCGADQIFENEPTLMPARGHITGGGSNSAVEVSSKSKTGNVFTISANGSAVTRSCTAPGQGSCPANGRW